MLINCPECGHTMSSEAEACPECGYPNRPQARESQGPKCYACSATATTRCQKCNALSCAQHLQSIYVRHGRGGAYELRCRTCYDEAMSWQTFNWVIAGAAVFIFILLFITMAVRH